MTTTMMKAEELGIPEEWRKALVLVLAKTEGGHARWEDVL